MGTITTTVESEDVVNYSTNIVETLRKYIGNGGSEFHIRQDYMHHFLTEHRKYWRFKKVHRSPFHGDTVMLDIKVYKAVQNNINGR